VRFDTFALSATSFIVKYAMWLRQSPCNNPKGHRIDIDAKKVTCLQNGKFSSHIRPAITVDLIVDQVPRTFLVPQLRLDERLLYIPGFFPLGQISGV